MDNILRLNNLSSRQIRLIDEADYLQNLTAIKVFRDVALKVKLSIEIYTYLKTLIGFMSNIGLIPFIVLSVFMIFKRLLTLFSLFFTSTLFLVKYTALNESIFYSSILNNLIYTKELLRVFCLKSYNMVFNENLPLYSNSPTPEQALAGDSVLLNKVHESNSY